MRLSPRTGHHKLWLYEFKEELGRIRTVGNGCSEKMALELKPSKDEQNQTKLTEPPLAIKEGATESLESPI